MLECFGEIVRATQRRDVPFRGEVVGEFHQLLGIDFHRCTGLGSHFVEGIEDQGGRANATFVLQRAAIEFIGLLNEIVDRIGVVFSNGLTQLGTGEHGVALRENTIVRLG